MFVATVPNRKSPPAILLRESYREGGKVKTRTLQNITKWPKARILALQRLLKGELDDGIPEESEPEQGKAIGALYALSDIARRIGITKALGRGRKARLALMLAVARLILQGSRLATVRWAEEEAVDEVLGAGKFDEDDLYSALDWLAEEQERIEERLFRERYGNTPPVLFLYDVTSSYLEGEENELADYGYNRDKKDGKKQIVIGLLTDPKGLPVAVRVFKGNTSDQNTVGDQVKALAKRFGVTDVTLVGDRGMLKGPQIDNLPDGFRYITAVTKPQIRKESRTRGHVLVVMLALLVQRHIETCLKTRFATASEIPQVTEVIRSLDRLCIYRQEVEGISVHKIMKPSARQAELLSALNVALPKMIVTDKMVSM